MRHGGMLTKLLLVLLAIGLALPMASDARGGGGRSGGGSFGGGRSSWGGSSRSYSNPSSSPRTGWGSGSSSSWGSGSRSSNTRGASAADRTLYNRAKTQGTAFNSRTAAVSDFRAKYGSQYTSRYSREPARRPDYIPQTTQAGGQNVPVIYNQSYGGYGFMSPLTHAWIMYDIWQNQAMMNRMMAGRGYYYGAPPVVHSSFNWGGLLFFLLIVGVIIYFIMRWRRAQRDAWGDGGPVLPTLDAVRREEEAAYVPDAAQPGYWRGLTVGSIISLSDKQALEDSIQENRGAVARDYTVQEVRTIHEQHDLAVWKLCRIADDRQALWFLAKIVGADVDLRVYFDLPDAQFTPGNRRDLVESGNLWLFQQPEDPEHFTYDALQFSTEIEGPGEEGQPPVIFHMKGQGALSGLMTVTGAGAEQQFATVVEYCADAGTTDNPELLLLEIGGVDLATGDTSPDGGLIILLQGAPLAPNEVDVLRQSPVR
ncbi:MAG TPA: hypothetical protein VGL77_05495 [Armatimonadota bacterium]